MASILVIEDEHELRDVILDIVQEENFNAIGAENGLIGVQLAQELKPDLIICDVMMPTLNGYEVLDELRKYPATETTPFIFLTALADPAQRRQGMEVGADDYLTKPFTREQLLKSVAARLEKKAVVDARIQTRLSELSNSISLSLPQELKVPLYAVAENAKLLIDELDIMSRDEIQTVAEQIYDASVHLSHIVQNFMLHSQLELTMALPDRQAALKQGVIHSSQHLVEQTSTAIAQLAHRDIDLVMDVQEAALQIAEARLKKIVRELVDNAFKFSPTGTTVQVISRIEQGFYTLSIIDSGRGMTDEQIDHLVAGLQFDRHLYQQAGAGLGLMIAKRLAELHDGALKIASIPGKLTTVQVTLPIAKSF